MMQLSGTVDKADAGMFYVLTVCREVRNVAFSTFK
jgi:hypothetical protein